MPTTTKSINDNVIETSKPGSITQDTKQPSLRLVVSPKGKRVWEFYKWDPILKKPIRQIIGLARGPGLLSIAEARTEVARLVGELGKPNRVAHVGGVPSFRKMVESYGKAWTTHEFNLQFSDWLDRPLNRVSLDDARDKAKQIKAKAAAESIRRCERAGKPLPSDPGAMALSRAAKAMRAVMNHAIKTKKFTGDNLGEAMDLAESQPRKVWMTDDQRERFLAVLDNNDSLLPAWARNYFKLLLATGSRKTVLLRCRWDAVDFKHKHIVLPAGTTKNGEDNYLQLGPTAIKILQDQRGIVGDSSAYVFPSVVTPERPVSQSWSEWETLRNEAGLKGLTPHDIRRTFGSLLVSRGAPMKVVSVAMNHKNVAVTEAVYGHVAPQAIHAALQLLE